MLICHYQDNGKNFPEHTHWDTWWRHQMETFSALLVLCAGNSPVTGEFPSQRPVTRSFEVFFDLRLNKRLSKQSWGWWFETPSCLLWRHCNDYSSLRHTAATNGTVGIIIRVFQDYFHFQYCSYIWNMSLEMVTDKNIEKNMSTRPICSSWWPSTVRFQVYFIQGPVAIMMIITVFPRYGDSHVKDKTVASPSYL